jgi:phosphatidylglycerophosphate synthase
VSERGGTGGAAQHPQYQEARREHKSLTAAAEKRLLVWMAERLPPWIGADHLTALGLAAFALGGLAYWMCRRDPLFLHAVNACLALNWLGDSLDGTVARVRQKLRPRYGFYVDHMVDALAALFLLLGLAYSSLITPAVAIALLVAYFFLTINMGYATHALGVFKISFGAFGGTEMRILLALVNLAVLRWPRVPLAGREVLLFDVFGTLATIAVAFTALRSTAQVAKRLYDLERIS